MELVKLKIALNKMCSKTKGMQAICAYRCVGVCRLINVEDAKECCAPSNNFFKAN
jgi:hypothetical protein